MRHESAARTEVFLGLHAQNARLFSGVVRAYARTAADRDDLLQEIAAALWRAFPAYDDRRSFSTWAYRIALNVAISFSRSGARHARHRARGDPAVPETAPAGAPSDPRLERLDDFLGTLGDLDRAAFLLWMESHSYAAIATAVGISETNVATKLGRLKLKARAALESDASPERERHGTR